MQPAGADEVRKQLERMLASRAFSGSARLRGFLQHVVEKTLAGEGDQLKEYAIGTDVFERDDQYDPRIDSIVRVEAGRLRAKIDEYYATEGAADPVVIRIARGTYVPVFESRVMAPAPPDSVPAGRRIGARRAASFALLAVTAAISIMSVRRLAMAPGDVPLPPSPPSLTVAVLPFTHYAPGGADEALAARLTDAVTSELARINAVGVVSRTTALQVARTAQPLPEMARLLNAGKVIEGSVVTDGPLVRVRTRIVDGRSDLKSAVRDFEGPRNNPDALARRIAESLSAVFLSVRPR